MRVARLGLLALGVVLSACADGPTSSAVKPTPEPSAPRALGLLEITFNDVGSPRMSAVAVPMSQPRQSSGASANMVPVAGGLQLGLRTTSTLDVGGERYLQAVFQVRNATADGTPNSRVLHNVTFIPVSTSQSIQGTPLKTMRKQDGADADATIAPQFRPTGAVMDNGSGGMGSGYPDVIQVFTENEVAAIDMSAYPAVTNRFPYGFITRRTGSTTTRDLPANPAEGQYDGTVTFAFRFPKQAVSADNPFTVSVQVVAVEDDEMRVTQSVEEQGAGQAAFEARVASLGATQVTVLNGGQYNGTAPVRALCTVRNGGDSGSPVSLLQTGGTVPAVGAVRRYTAMEAQSLCVEGGTAGAEYTLMPVNSSETSAVSLSVLATGTTATTGAPNPDVTPSGLGTVGTVDAGSFSFHLKQLETERAALAGRTLYSKTRAGLRADAPSNVITTGVPAVGDLMALNVGSACSGTPDVRTGRVRTVSTRAIIVSDTANPAGGFTTAQYDSMALEFDSIGYPVNVNNFGAPTDLDGNGRIVIFFTRGVNELSPPASSITSYGYFAARDLFDNAANGCTQSNLGEMLYALTPDPTGAVNSNVRTVSSVRGNFNLTMTHELQHLINASRRMYVQGASSLEEAWLNEGLSGIAEELAFYRTSFGLAPRGNIVLSSLNTGPNASRRVAAYNTYSNQNFTKLRGWLQRPDTTGAFKPNDSNSMRGALWAFLRYAADRKGGTESAFWSSLVNTSATGRANLQAAIGAEPEPWLRDFTVAIYAANSGVTGLSSEFSTPSWNYRSVYGGLGGFPVLIRPLTSGTPLTLSYSRGGGTAYIRFRVEPNTSANLSALSGGVAAPSSTNFMLLRTR